MEEIDKILKHPRNLLPEHYSEIADNQRDLKAAISTLYEDFEDRISKICHQYIIQPESTHKLISNIKMLKNSESMKKAILLENGDLYLLDQNMTKR